jgi:phage-related protein
VIVRDAHGDESHRLTLTGTLATNDALVIDSARQTIDRYVAGVLQTGTASGNAWLTSGQFPLLAPEDAINGDGITVELTSTSGTPTGLLLYTRGY